MGSSDTDFRSAIIGAPLGQVFQVRLKKINNGAEKCQLFGTISIEDEDARKGAVYIYNRAQDDAEFVYQGGNLSVSGVKRVVYAYHSFRVILDLKDEDGSEFIKSSFVVDLKSSKIYDKLLTYNVLGIKGEATVYLSVLKIAVPAGITVNVKSTSDSVKLSGRIVAYYGRRFYYGEDNMEYGRLKLFSKEGEDIVQVSKDNAKIPLLVSCVAVPAYSSLTIDAKFECDYPDGTREQIFKDPVDIPADHVYFNTVHFEGEKCKIVLEVFYKGAKVAGDNPFP